MSIKNKKKEDSPKTGLIILLFMFFLADRLLMLSYSPYLYLEDDIKIGAFTHDIRNEGGLKMPLIGYLGTPHGWARFFIVLETYAMSFITGTNYLAIKAAIIFNSSLLFVISLLFLHRYFGKKEMIIGGILLILGTPSYLQKNLMMYGPDLFLSMLLMIGLFCFIEMARIKRILHVFLIGTVSGVFFTLHYGTIIIPALISVRMAAKREFRKMAYFFAGAAIGLLPLAAFNLAYFFPSIHADLLLTTAESGIGGILTGIFRLFAYLIPKSFHFRDLYSVSAKNIAYLFYFAMISVISIFFMREKKPKKQTAALLLFPFALLIMLSSGGFSLAEMERGFLPTEIISDYYLGFFHHFLIMVLAVGIASLIALNKRAGIIAFFFFVCILMLGHLQVFSKEFNNYLLEPMHSTEMLAYETGSNYVIHPPLFSWLHSRLRHEDNLRTAYIWGAAAGTANIASRREFSKGLDKKILDSIAALPEKERDIFFYYFFNGEEPQSYQNLNRKTFERLCRLVKGTYMLEDCKDILEAENAQ